MPLALIESGVKLRIQQVLRHKEISVKELCGKRDLDHRSLSDQLTKTSVKLGYCLIYLLAEKFDDISLRWMLTGEGEMIKDAKLKKRAERMQQRIEEMEYTIELQKELIEQLKKNNTFRMNN